MVDEYGYDEYAWTHPGDTPSEPAVVAQPEAGNLQPQDEYATLPTIQEVASGAAPEPYLAGYEARNAAADAYQAAHPEASWYDALAAVGANIPDYMLSGYVNPPPTETMLTMDSSGVLGYREEYILGAEQAGVELGTPIPPVVTEVPGTPQQGIIQGMGGAGTGGAGPITGGGTFMTAINPGDSPTNGYASVAVSTAGDTYGGRDQIGWWAILLAGGTIVLGAIKWLIAKVGWQTILAVVGTAVGAKILALINDGSSDATAVAVPGSAGGDGSKIIKNWTAGNWPFYLTADGRIHTTKKNGIAISWKPKKPIVLVRGSTSLSQFVRAERYLDKMSRSIARRTKSLQLQQHHSKN
jgi:hypothetical protein